MGASAAVHQTTSFHHIAPARFFELHGGVVDLAPVYFFVLVGCGNRVRRQLQLRQNGFPFHTLNLGDHFQRADPQAISNSRACVISRLPTGRTSEASSVTTAAVRPVNVKNSTS